MRQFAVLLDSAILAVYQARLLLAEFEVRRPGEGLLWREKFSQISMLVETYRLRGANANQPNDAGKNAMAQRWSPLLGVNSPTNSKVLGQRASTVGA